MRGLAWLAAVCSAVTTVVYGVSAVMTGDLEHAAMALAFLALAFFNLKAALTE